MARHSQGAVTSHMISYKTVATLVLQNWSCNWDIINFTTVLVYRLAGVQGKVAADGSKFEIYENNLHSEYHIRYGGYGGIAYHHVSDKYIALFTHFITCGVGGCLYFGWAVENSSDIQPDTLHADTQGQSGPVFAISYLLGIKLMPRIRNWKDLTFCSPQCRCYLQVYRTVV